MKPMHILMLASIALTAPAISHAQVAGTTLLGVSVAEMREVAKGWSVKRTILGQPVYNEKDESVGSVDDIIIAPDKAISYAIVNAGGFLGLARHDVAIPVSQFKLVDKKLVLPGATKEALKASPEFQYAPRKCRRACIRPLPVISQSIRTRQAKQKFSTSQSGSIVGEGAFARFSYLANVPICTPSRSAISCCVKPPCRRAVETRAANCSL